MPYLKNSKQCGLVHSTTKRHRRILSFLELIEKIRHLQSVRLQQKPTATWHVDHVRSAAPYSFGIAVTF